MLQIFKHFQDSDLKETEVDISVLENLNTVQISNIPEVKRAAIALVLIKMLQAKGAKECYDTAFGGVLRFYSMKFDNLMECSHARLGQIIRSLIVGLDRLDKLSEYGMCIHAVPKEECEECENGNH